jgi:hypothetical protein
MRLSFYQTASEDADRRPPARMATVAQTLVVKARAEDADNGIIHLDSYVFK